MTKKKHKYEFALILSGPSAYLSYCFVVLCFLKVHCTFSWWCSVYKAVWSYELLLCDILFTSGRNIGRQKHNLVIITSQCQDIPPELGIHWQLNSWIAVWISALRPTSFATLKVLTHSGWWFSNRGDINDCLIWGDHRVVCRVLCLSRHFSPLLCYVIQSRFCYFFFTVLLTLVFFFYEFRPRGNVALIHVIPARLAGPKKRYAPFYKGQLTDTPRESISRDKGFYCLMNEAAGNKDGQKDELGYYFFL